MHRARHLSGLDRERNETGIILRTDATSDGPAARNQAPLAIVGTAVAQFACLAWLVAIVPGCGGGDATGTTASTPSDSAAPLAIKAGSQTGSGSAVTPDRYALNSTSSQPLVRIQTSLGPVVVRLDPQAARVTVQNFLNYVQSGHYSDTVFHYVERGRMVLGGGITADGSAKPVGMSIRNEAHNGLKNRRGTIAMARDAAVIDSATSQFFINLHDAPHLDHSGETPEQYGYCVFGEVVEGLDVVDRIAAVPTEKQVIEGAELEVPAKTVRIEAVQILK